jgi:hypothetical protein
LKELIIKQLTDQEPEAVEKFAAYCTRLQVEKNRDGNAKNPWMQNRKPEDLAALFRRVQKDGLVFDGVHVTLQKTGVNYDYVAYKNKMLIAYPETLIDVGMVYDGDEFYFSKENGHVKYRHIMKTAFQAEHNDEKIIGGYCIVKNSRGEFITLLTRDEISKHRKVAKTDTIWTQWFKEMCLKTLIKKAAKMHFDDLYENINTLDNENSDVEKQVFDHEVDNLRHLIVEKLQIYQGEDKLQITKQCKALNEKGWTVEAANEILKKL